MSNNVFNKKKSEGGYKRGIRGLSHLAGGLCRWVIRLLEG